VWVHLGRDPELPSRVEKALETGDKVVIAPPALRSTKFCDDKKIYLWMTDHKCDVLDLPRPFMAKILGTTLPKSSGSTPKHSE
jgi:hypothetical protein